MEHLQNDKTIETENRVIVAREQKQGGKRCDYKKG